MTGWSICETYFNKTTTYFNLKCFFFFKKYIIFLYSFLVFCCISRNSMWEMKTTAIQKTQIRSNTKLNLQLKLKSKTFTSFFILFNCKLFWSRMLSCFFFSYLFLQIIRTYKHIEFHHIRIILTTFIKKSHFDTSFHVFFLFTLFCVSSSFCYCFCYYIRLPI